MAPIEVKEKTRINENEIGKSLKELIQMISRAYDLPKYILNFE